MVPGAGLEPARYYSEDFKSLVSTNSTTRAIHMRYFTSKFKINHKIKFVEAEAGIEPA